MQMCYVQAAAAVRAVFDVDVEDPFEQPGPTQARRRVIACGRGCLLWRTGDDFTTQLCVRREHTMEAPAESCPGPTPFWRLRLDSCGPAGRHRGGGGRELQQRCRYEGQPDAQREQDRPGHRQDGGEPVDAAAPGMAGDPVHPDG